MRPGKHKTHVMLSVPIDVLVAFDNYLLDLQREQGYRPCRSLAIVQLMERRIAKHAESKGRKPQDRR